jgi:hypothetical protein
MSLKADREPVEVDWLTGTAFPTLRVTRYVVHANGWLTWIHPFDVPNSSRPIKRRSRPSDWRKMKP